jgi:hypothetical protein
MLVTYIIFELCFLLTVWLQKYYKTDLKLLKNIDKCWSYYIPISFHATIFFSKKLKLTSSITVADLINLNQDLGRCPGTSDENVR